LQTVFASYSVSPNMFDQRLTTPACSLVKLQHIDASGKQRLKSTQDQRLKMTTILYASVPNCSLQKSSLAPSWLTARPKQLRRSLMRSSGFGKTCWSFKEHWRNEKPSYLHGPKPIGACLVS